MVIAATYQARWTAGLVGARVSTGAVTTAILGSGVGAAQGDVRH
jgi:hypothetical protein